MSSNLKYSAALKNAQQDAITAKAGANAKLDIYSGAQPASPDVAVTSQVKLAECACSATFAAAAAGGVLTAGAISNGTGTAGASTGTAATWWRLTDSSGVAHVDGTVGTATADMILTNVSIATGQTVQVNSLTLTNAQ